MKIKLTLTAILTGLALSVIAAPPLAISNYFAGAVVTLTSFTNAGDSGLTTGTVYVCIPSGSVTNADYTPALVTNDVRPFVSSVVHGLRVSIAAKVSTNQFTSYTITESMQYGSAGTNRTMGLAINEEQNVSVTPSYPSQ